MRIPIRQYGTAGPWVVVLHGGPGAAGYMAPLARELAGSFRVLEPLQRASGGEPLTVAAHVADLDELVEARCGTALPAIVGHSWGAMLALAYAATHPGRARSLVLIGCGSFDSATRHRMQASVEGRMDDALRRRLARLPEEYPDPDARLRILGNLMLPLYSCDPVATELDVELCDARGYGETWRDMLRLQAEGAYPAAFGAIRVPVMMLHGQVDPHPGRMIEATLRPYLPQLEYREWDRCGHYPWLERTVRRGFTAVLQAWLAEQCRA